MYYCILTGGKSRRMGQDKAFLDVGGKFLVEVLAERFLDAGCRLCLSSAHGDMAGRLVHLKKRPLEVADRVQEVGPIGGIASLLRGLDEDIFVMATDMPFADIRLAELIVAAAENKKADMCLLERSDGRLEPLFGFYSRTCLGAVEEMISEGNYRLTALADRVKLLRISETELAEAYGTGWEQVLFNMNTPKDYERALQMYNCVAKIKNNA